MANEVKDIPTTKTNADVQDTDWFEGQTAAGGALSSFKIAKSELTTKTAAQIPFTPAGNLSSTDVEAALVELDTEKVAKVNSATALTDGASIDITGPMHTLTTADSRTFTISYTGNFMLIETTLNSVEETMTFPVGSLCRADGVPSGDNTLTLEGTSGDKHIIAIERIGSVNYVVSANFGQ